MVRCQRLFNFVRDANTFPERRKILYHKPEVERVWEEWLSLPAEDTVREEFRRAQQERAQQITQVRQLIVSQNNRLTSIAAFIPVF